MGISCCYSTSGTRRVTIKRDEHNVPWKPYWTPNETTWIKHGPSTKQIELKKNDAQKSRREKEENKISKKVKGCKWTKWTTRIPLKLEWTQVLRKSGQFLLLTEILMKISNSSAWTGWKFPLPPEKLIISPGKLCIGKLLVYRCKI